MVDYIRQGMQGFIQQEGDLELPPSSPTTPYNSQSLWVGQRTYYTAIVNSTRRSLYFITDGL